MASGTLIVIASDCVAVPPLASVTWTTTSNVPVLVGVPLIWPALERFKLPGSDPEAMFQLYGGAPPTAESVWK